MTVSAVSPRSSSSLVPLPRLWSAAAVAFFCCLAFTANGSAQASSSAATITASEDAGRCTVREVGRDSLMLGRRRLYVGPQSLEANAAGELFLASDYNALMDRDSAGVWKPVVMDSVVGVVISPQGMPRLVHAPIGNRLLGEVRVAPNTDGSWTVVYAERLESDELPPDFKPRNSRRLWSGIVRGAELTMLDTLPHPEGWIMSADLSPMARTGDTLAVAVIAQVPNDFRRTIIFERRDGRWAYESLVTRFGMWAAPGYSPVSGLVMASVESDPYTPGSSGNTLFIWQRRGEWERTRRVIPGEEQGVQRPSLLFRADGSGSLSWMTAPAGRASWRAFAMSGNVAEKNEPVVTVEPATSVWADVFALPWNSHSDLWIMPHEDRPGEMSQIRFVDAAGNLLHHLPTPFVTDIASVRTGNGEYVVVGGVYNTTELHVTTVLLRFQVECAR
ncbi:MAG TPA: hypothetical protein VF665_12720 [Longimicrobium sp.]|uniref:hypothetical protein n=1 Tax=Longimicrobium sp. TaxID=2029185 RepID=UPI002ED785C3